MHASAGGRLTLEHRLSRAHYSPWRSETKTTCLRGISAAPVHELHAHGGILAVLHPGRDVKLCYRDISWRNPTPFLTRRLSLDTTRCLGLVVKHPDSRPVSRGQMGYIWQNQSPVGHSAVGDSSALDTVGRTVEMMTLVEIRHAAYILGNTAELVRTWRK